MRTIKSFGLAALVAGLTISTSWAARFSNQFVEFEMPPKWQCNLEGAEWVCQSTDESKKNEAIIVLAAKLKGEQDSLDQYLEYLKAPKTYQSVRGGLIKSEPKYAKPVNVNGHPWIDSFHSESEIPGFYTRYFATIKNDIGVLVTYSVDKQKYPQYIKEFEVMVNTLKVFRKPGGVNTLASNSNLFNRNIPQSISEGSIFPNPNLTDEEAPEQKPAPSGDEDFYLILVIVGVIGFIIWKRKKNKAAKFT